MCSRQKIEAIQRARQDLQDTISALMEPDCINVESAKKARKILVAQKNMLDWVLLLVGD